ncbi:MAG TPA: AI-2E family transporter [Pirellulales bacterium]|jgi:predicted PurR-regulated permease PerM|nr:AI-2E family transporter [Pirellulales bacterium]
MTRIALNIATLFATLTGLAVLWEFRGAALIFCMSLALAAAVRPAVEFFIQRHWPVALAVGATYLPLLCVVGLLIFLSVSRMGDEFNQMVDDSGRAYQQIDEHWRHGNWIEQQIAQSMPSLGKSDNAKSETAKHDGWELRVAKTLFGYTLSVAGVIFDALLVVVMSVYWSLDRVHFERLWLSLLSASTRVSARQIWRAIEKEIGKYLRSEFLQSLMAGLLLAFGFWLIGCSYPILLALVGAAAWLIPWVGALFAVLALTLTSLPTLITDSTWHGVLVLAAATLYTCMVLLLLEILVEPRLFDRQRYSTVLTAFVAISLAMMWGVFGLLIGPPLAVVLQVFGSFLLRRRLGLTGDTAQGPAEVAARLAELRRSLAGSQSPHPELENFVDRLTTIMQEVREEIAIPAADRPKIGLLLANRPRVGAGTE